MTTATKEKTGLKPIQMSVPGHEKTLPEIRKMTISYMTQLVEGRVKRRAVPLVYRKVEQYKALLRSHGVSLLG